MGNRAPLVVRLGVMDWFTKMRYQLSSGANSTNPKALISSDTLPYLLHVSPAYFSFLTPPIAVFLRGPR